MKLPKNYLQAQMFLGNKNRRSLSRVSGTFVQRVSSETIKIVYGGYTFIEFKDDGNIVLNSGGKRSSAIKNRINALEEIVLFERAGKWYFYQVQASFPQLAPIFEFVDGLVYDCSYSLEREKKKLEQATGHGSLNQ